jgi:hypothetical protein
VAYRCHHVQLCREGWHRVWSHLGPPRAHLNVPLQKFAPYCV